MWDVYLPELDLINVLTTYKFKSLLVLRSQHSLHYSMTVIGEFVFGVMFMFKGVLKRTNNHFLNIRTYHLEDVWPYILWNVLMFGKLLSKHFSPPLSTWPLSSYAWYQQHLCVLIWIHIALLWWQCQPSSSVVCQVSLFFYCPKKTFEVQRNSKINK